MRQKLTRGFKKTLTKTLAERTVAILCVVLLMLSTPLQSLAQSYSTGELAYTTSDSAAEVLSSTDEVANSTDDAVAESEDATDSSESENNTDSTEDASGETDTTEDTSSETDAVETSSADDTSDDTEVEDVVQESSDDTDAEDDTDTSTAATLSSGSTIASDIAAAGGAVNTVTNSSGGSWWWYLADSNSTYGTAGTLYIGGSGIMNPSSGSNGWPWIYSRSQITAVVFDSGSTAGSDLSYMFYGSSLTSVDASNLDTSSVTVMESMFQDCSKLETLTLSTKWSTSNVTNMQAMFSDCSALTTLDLSNWNTQNVTSMGSMFSSCSSLRSITLGENFSFKGADSGDIASDDTYQALLPTPSSSASLTREWIKLDSNNNPIPTESYAAIELRDSYVGTSMAGTYVWDTTGALTITKSITGSTFEVFDRDGTTEFTFTITLTGAGGFTEYPVTITDSDTDTLTFTYDKSTDSYTATITLKGSQSATISGILPGAKYTVTEAKSHYTVYSIETTTITPTNPSGSLDVAFPSTNTDGSVSVTNTISANTEIAYNFVNHRKAGTLLISKTVNPDDASKQPDDGFAFTVVADDESFSGTYTAVISDENATEGDERTEVTVTFEDGKLTRVTYDEDNYTDGLYLKDGQSIFIEALPAGEIFTVTEVAATYVDEDEDDDDEEDHTHPWNTTVTAHDVYDETEYGPTTSNDDKSAKVTVTADDEALIYFTNYITEDDDYGTLLISKQVDGNAASSSQYFYFKIVLDVASYEDDEDHDADFDPTKYTNVSFIEGADGKATAVVALEANTTFTISKLPAGMSYTITEYLDEDCTLLASSAGYTVKVNSLDVDDATTSGTISSYTSGTAIAAFLNHRDYSYLEVIKTISGDGVSSNQEFSFKITLTNIEDYDNSFDYINANNSSDDISYDPDSGTITFTLKGGDSKVISLIQGLEYTVEELNTENYDVTIEKQTVAGDDDDHEDDEEEEEQNAGSISLAETLAAIAEAAPHLKKMLMQRQQQLPALP